MPSRPRTGVATLDLRGSGTYLTFAGGVSRNNDGGSARVYSNPLVEKSRRKKSEARQDPVGVNWYDRLVVSPEPELHESV